MWFRDRSCDQLGETSHVVMCNLIFFDTCKNKEDIENRKGDRVLWPERVQNVNNEENQQ